MTDKLTVYVPGIPRPQGSKRAFQQGGKIVLVEANAGLKDYRDVIASSARAAVDHDGWEMLEKDVPILVRANFYLPRPKSVTRIHHTVPPDLDKLLRALLDGLTQAGNVWHDDSQVTLIIAAKYYIDLHPRTLVEISYA